MKTNKQLEWKYICRVRHDYIALLDNVISLIISIINLFQIRNIYKYLQSFEKSYRKMNGA